ncbi:Splicing factor 3b, subunit 2, 145kD [Taphrina deformans PYCC 5710]|uniref:Splicing factor 3b, subunit 2, 145kD n=1 Tax=Taphrina deformans (strain PYCC 5710 / ATCC 11124 / CBS 356.35 / IMI 108563 / JCM 9778 / NBRC 8474) TaxID=1097556 RepID=R4X6B3_TAPDE|nr:Splicing factor 3b, subunit 2, 145kD [Taphrina deformans PYCC 5710]|eukprot:CCG80540.1 Splicing factor 3b, subunit 2, 145kD [Taphrina deformans PYCC 5710]
MVAAKDFKSKNAARRAAKKLQKAAQGTDVDINTEEVEHVQEKSEKRETSNSILDEIADGLDETALEEFRSVLDRFQLPAETPTSGVRLISSDEKGQVMYDEDDNIPDEDDMKSVNEEDEEAELLSKTRQKKQNRLNVAELKQLVKKPEVVEWTDVSAPDPKLLVSLKSVINSVPVPSHWSQKRDYLAGKRGVEKTSFELPDFIRATGVGEMRQAAQEQREQQSLKQQMRARVQPKMGRLDIDYQKLHDAFFRFQTKPPMTKYGETYYEGKEYETNTREKRPGDLSEDLKEALSIPPGAPPPWLISMQRFGPPPSYPSLKIPGLNAPIPSGGQWGFHPGGWGKPPTDEYNRPLYGDVFGILQPAPSAATGEAIDKDLWGELEIAEDESSEEEEEAEDEDEDEETADLDGEAMTEGMQTGSGMTSMAPSGIATPDHIELRKARAREDQDDDDGQEMDGEEEEEEVDLNRPKTLYQVLPERRENVKGFYGSSHSYAVPTAGPVVTASEARTRETITKLDGRDPRKRTSDDVNLALDPEKLAVGLSREEMEAEYERERAERSGRPGNWDEDLSEMVSEAAAQAQKRQKLRANPDKKKEKFKF